MLMAQWTHLERRRDFRGNVSARLIYAPHRNVTQRLNFYQSQDGVVNVNRKNLFLWNIPRLNRWKVFDNWTCLCVVALFAADTFALDTKKPLADFMHQTWSVDNGLPQSTIRGISQTRDGYLWFATHEGVARFDGLAFTVFDEANTPVVLMRFVEHKCANRRVSASVCDF